ncbi:MAG: stage III sporulation protein AE [Firmicutes bacterium]|nr:stage III sporulation protein AE [Candidatus Fermentithermobacillaceae bacterium]
MGPWLQPPASSCKSRPQARQNALSGRTGLIGKAVLALLLSLLMCSVGIAGFAGVPGTETERNARSGSPVLSGNLPGPPLTSLDDSGVSAVLDEVQSELEALPSYSWKELVGDVLSGKGPDWKRIGLYISGKVLGQVVTIVPFLGKLILVCVVMGLLEIIASSITRNGAAHVATWACFLVLAVMAWSSFQQCADMARQAVNDLLTLLYALVPVMAGLTASSGAPISAAALHPLVLGAGYVVATVITDIALPLLFTATAMEFAAGLGVEGRVSGASELLRQVAMMVIGVTMASFVGVVVSQRASAGVADGVALRTAKYLSSTFVPVAGKMVSDTMEMFFLASSALRSALGVAGSVLVLAVASLPLIRILGVLLAWKLAAASCSAFLPSRAGKSMRAVSSAIGLVATSVGVTAFVFVICISLVAGAVRAF